MTAPNDRWFFCPQPKPDAALRLFCLPFAGAGASLYRTWFGAFPHDIEVRAVQLPGRESRMSEPRVTSAAALAGQIADALAPWLDRPFALFGYSLGGLLAFETVRELRRRGTTPPACLFVAAMHAPHVPPVRPPIAHLPRDEFIAKVNHYYQPTDAAWQIPELLELFMPILRDDIAIADAYACAQEPPLSCPIEVYAGADDRSVPAASVEAWQAQTTASCNRTTFPGGHFFLHERLPQLQDKVRGRLGELLRNGGGVA